MGTRRPVRAKPEDRWHERATLAAMPGVPTHDDDDDEMDPEEAERRIAEFIDAADARPGPPVARLADDVAAAVGEAWRAAEALMADVPVDKLLATMFLVSRRARQLGPDEPRQWQLHAASTLLSGLVGQRRPG